MDSDNEDGFAIEENYYAFLNVSHEATHEEIQSAYRQLSRLYHPDKHANNVENKEKAELLFNRVKKAYEILSDPHKRAIYDSLGVKGLETEGWEIMHRTKTPAEIREEYEQLAREREERRLQQRTNPKGNITININATDLFNAYGDEYDDGSGPFPNVEVSGMSISQSIEAPITIRDTVVMSGNVAMSNGIGSGGFMFSGKRLINKGWIELDMGAGNGPALGIKGSRTLSQRVFCNGGATINLRRNGIVPGLVGTFAVQLDKHTVGYLTYTAGMQTSMSTSVEHNSENQHAIVTLQLGIPHSFVSASYTRKLMEQEMKVRLAAKVGTFGFLVEYGAEKKVSKYSSLYASVTVGLPTGVIMKIKVIRSSQSFIFPIHLSEDLVPAAVFYATATPLLGYILVKKLIIDPMDAQQKKRTLEKTKEANKERIIERRREAEAAIDLMLATYDRIKTEEDKKHGLLILSAKYGKFPEGYSQTDDNETYNEELIDVTIPLQCLVKDSKLLVYATGKSELPGFYDPCIGEDKELKVVYLYKEHSYAVTVPDDKELKLPLPTNS